MLYSPEILEHFSNPRNVGEIPDASGVGSIGDPGCGDALKIWIKVEDEHIADIKFKCLGCPAAIATTSAFTEYVKGMHLNEAVEVDADKVEELVGGLPEVKRHCSVLGPSALYNAAIDYVFRETVRRNE